MSLGLPGTVSTVVFICAYVSHIYHVRLENKALTGSISC